MPTHEDYTNYVINQIKQINPYTKEEYGYAYAVGFLASYVANILEEDEFRLKQFRRHIERVKHQSK